MMYYYYNFVSDILCRCLDPKEEIDLINVAFDQSKTNDEVK